jgi:hypothetical protein
MLDELEKLSSQLIHQLMDSSDTPVEEMQDVRRELSPARQRVDVAFEKLSIYASEAIRREASQTLVAFINAGRELTTTLIATATLRKLELLFAIREDLGVPAGSPDKGEYIE